MGKNANEQEKPRQSGNPTRPSINKIMRGVTNLWNRPTSGGQSRTGRQTSSSKGMGTAQSSRRANPIRVFVVDDHPSVREGTSRLLKSEPGITVTGGSESVEDCLEKLNNQTADVVLMDINLPGVDGIQGITQLKAKHSDLKVVIFSSFGGEYLDKAVHAGADGYLLKTASKLELVNAVVQAASGHSPIFDSKLTESLLERLAVKQDTDAAQHETDGT